MSFCNDPGYHEHGCPGYSLERIADLLERIAEALDPTVPQVEDRWKPLTHPVPRVDGDD